MREIEEKCEINAPAEVFNILIDFCCQQGEVNLPALVLLW